MTARPGPAARLSVSAAAVVIVPTHDHGATLDRSVRSAMEQTVANLEIIVLGDGAPDETRDVMAELVAIDERVRYVDHPKGERHGESYRHSALQESGGAVVCYLCDDDLWLPDHVASMIHLLDGADITHSLPVGITAEGHIELWRVDLAHEADRQLHLDGHNRVPLSCFAHTREAYDRLPQGWVPASPTVPTDLFFYQQFLRQPWCRAVSGWCPTAVHFPSPLRTTWSHAERLEELDRWRADLRHDPSQWRVAVIEHVARELVARARVQSEADDYADTLLTHIEALEAHQRELGAYVRHLEATIRQASS